MNLFPLVSRLSIVDKQARLVPFQPNWAQTIFLNEVNRQTDLGLPVRIISLKARQLGISTVTEAVMFSMAFIYERMKGLIVAHEVDSSQHLLAMTDIFWQTYPFRSCYTPKYQSRNELAWKETGSSLRVATAANAKAGRGRTLHGLHCSEVGFWMEPEKTMLGLRQTVPHLPGTFISIESTANGVGNWFYNTWQAAEAGDTDYVPIFLPWHHHPEYMASAINLPYSQLGNLDSEERALRAMGLSDDRLSWRRWAIKNLADGDVNKFKQEYPAISEEAFIATGSNVFPMGKLRDVYDHMEGRVGRLARDGDTVRFQPDVSGPLRVFRMPSQDKDWGVYMVAGDPTHTCYSDDTEVLTQRGWIRFAEALPSDEFATRSRQAVFEWQHATDFTTHVYKGDMYNFHSQCTDILVTPNHRMLVESLPVTLGGGYGPRDEGGYFVRADDLAEHWTSKTKIPRKAGWHGIHIESFHLDKMGASGNPVNWSGDTYCAFMGMYLAEGSRSSKGGVDIAQRSTSRGYQEYKALCATLGFRFCESQGKFCMTNLPLHLYLAQFATATKKYIPDLIRNATKEQLEIFWHYYWLGDGSVNRGQEVAITSSPVMAGQLQEIFVKMGDSGNITTRIPKPGAGIGDRVFVNTHPGYIVRRSTSHNAKFLVDKVAYSGTVYCVTVPNETLYVRRNGKAAWCGNTRGDAACAQVISRRTLEQVAVYRHRLDPGTFAEELAKIGVFYNVAMVTAEVEGPGYATISRLIGLDYPNMWYNRVADTTPGKTTDHFGWRTTAKSKQLCIGWLLKMIVDKDVKIHDRQTFTELRDYVTKPDGGYGPAANNGFDDTVMALAIAVTCHVLEAPMSAYAGPDTGGSGSQSTWQEWGAGEEVG